MFEMESRQLFEMMSGPWRLNICFKMEAGQLFNM